MSDTVTTPRANMRSGWNFADIWEHQADRWPDALALAQGTRAITWAEADRRADGVAATLLAAGAAHQSNVALYLHNCPEYLEAMFGIFKAGLVPVNTNYRYTDDELADLWDDADAVAVVFHGAFTDRCAVVRARVPMVGTWLWVDDGSGPCPDWAVPYELAAASAHGRVTSHAGRSGDDLVILYTGGTTGAPKGVMWRQDDVFGVLEAGSRHRLPAGPGWDELDARTPRPGPRNLPAAPLMHGTAAFYAMWTLCLGGAVVMPTGRSFDTVEMLDTVERHHVNSITIVGDVFARPIADALDAQPRRWDLSSVKVVISSGVMWSPETKARLLRHLPALVMVDSLGSSEAIGIATSIVGGDAGAPSVPDVGQFTLGPTSTVLDEQNHPIARGTGRVGRLAIRGRLPLGYYKDRAKTDATFVVVDGQRWSVPGDWAEVDADGSIRLLGRGSQSINTGGEKVFPEEVEEVLKRHPAVADAAVVGVPDDRFGEAVAAVVELRPGMVLDAADLMTHARRSLAGYKIPRRYVQVPSVGRAANGKLDYSALRAIAMGEPLTG